MGIGRVSLSCLLLATAPANLALGRCSEGSTARKTENVILVTLDGLRWQEMFTGAEEALISKEAGGVTDVEGLRRELWRDTPEARREALLPFVWGTVAKEGQILGNPAKGSVATLVNGKKFSYPGYNEILCGFGDPRIDSNRKVPNPNVSVLEWLNGQDAFRGRISAFSEWDCMPFILNEERSGLYVNGGAEPFGLEGLSDRQKALDDVVRETVWPHDDQRSDALTFLMGLEHFRRTSPRVFYLSFGETDEYAHEGRYDLVLRAARASDDCVRRLWQLAQTMPAYSGRTSLVITTDHGRGDGPKEWKNHGERVAGAERIWIAVMGPDTPALGERADVDAVTQGQVAATVAALLGEDWCAAEPRAAKPIADVMPGQQR